MKLINTPSNTYHINHELRLCLKALRDHVEYCATHGLDVEINDLLLIASYYPTGFDQIINEKIELNFPAHKTVIRFHEKDTL